MVNITAFGSNGSGQLGIGHHSDVATPQVCLGIEGTECEGPIRAISAGGNHTLLLFRNGVLFGTGANDKHQMSHGDSMSKFRRISDVTKKTSEDRFRLIAATWEASVLVSQDGTVYTCGSGPKGELGQGEHVDVSAGAAALQGFPPPSTTAVGVAASMSHVVAVLSSGDVFGWGNGRKGELGLPAGMTWTPRKISVPFTVEQATCGRDFTCLAASPRDGRLAILGSDKYGIVETAPQRIAGWDQLEASWCSMHVLAKDGLISWGRKDRGQTLGSGVPDICKIAAGSEHVLAERSDGLALAWGWGEHGNCGLDASESAAHIIPTTGRIVFLGAGCATSFICFEDSKT